jgi:hypothetical protein
MANGVYLDRPLRGRDHCCWWEGRPLFFYAKFIFCVNPFPAFHKHN